MRAVKRLLRLAESEMRLLSTEQISRMGENAGWAGLVIHGVSYYGDGMLRGLYSFCLSPRRQIVAATIR